MLELKKQFQSQLRTAQTTAFDKGYAEAIQCVRQRLKTRSKKMLSLIEKFEKEFAQLMKPKTNKTTKVKKVKKVNKAEEVVAAAEENADSID